MAATPPTSNHTIPADYQVYLHPDFDAQSFANSVLNNEPYHSKDPIPSQSGSANVSLALSKLNLGIEDITKQLRAEVSTHHLKLLAKASSVASLHGSLESIKAGLQQIEANVDRLQRKIGLRHSTLDNALVRLDRYQSAAELCRRTNRFVSLAKRLEGQMAELDSSSADGPVPENLLKSRREQREIVLAESALTLSELEKLLDSELEPAELSTPNSPPGSPPGTSPSIRSLRAVQPHVQAIISARKKVEYEMGKMLNEGLVQLDRAMLASSFQTAYNLSTLDSSVGSLILDLTEVVRTRVKLSFDINLLAREAGANESVTTSSFGYKSRARTEPTAAALPQWTNVLWARLGALIDDLTSCCVKVYTLEKVLEWKRDPITGVSFLDGMLSQGSVLEDRPSTVFWTTLSTALGKETREASRTSNFINQTLTNSYPHLLRLFHDFFSRISLHTHTTYNSNTQSPETVLTLRAVSPLENIYLTRSTARMTEATSGRVEQLTAVIGNELDAARFDPLLVRSVAKKVKDVVENYVKWIDSRIITDYQSTSLAGPVATSSQLTNIDLFNTLSQLSSSLSQLVSDYAEDIHGLIQPTILQAVQVRDAIIGPLTVAVRRELSGIVAKMHGGRTLATSGSGVYMQELSTKLSLIRVELFGRMRQSVCEPLLIETTQHLLRTFLFHASLVTPLAEAAKLRLAADLAELEFGIAQFLASDDHAALVNELEALRTFRQLLFADTEQEVGELVGETTLDELIVVHHLIVKGQSEAGKEHEKVRLAHQVNNWSEAEYLRWVEEHPVQSERMKLVKKSLEQTEELKEEGKWTRMALKFLEARGF